jgi:NitT/TauT family transport system permease protein
MVLRLLEASTFSMLRMLAAYAASLVFAVSYGMAAGRSRKAERFLIPLLDVVQSVPVLGFFPAAVYFFIALTNGRRLGVEAAAVFLIFTGQAWNMAFGVYEAVTTLPEDASEAARALGLSGWQRFRRLLLPAAVPKLVYNSILSWAAGWYFLVACEIIAIGSQKYSLPGLGSLIQSSMERGDVPAMAAGIATLVAIVVALDLLVWRPLTVWAEKYRFEFTAASPGQSRVFDYYRDSGFSRMLGGGVDGAWRLVEAVFRKAGAICSGSISSGIRRAGRRAAALLPIGAAAAGVAALLAVAISRMGPPVPSDVAEIPKAIAFSFLRLAIAYAISLSWTIPLALWAGDSDRVGRVVTPIAEVAASVPATAFFPVIVFFVVRALGSVNVASVLLVLTGMQWYLLFNALAGARQVPGEIKEMARSFGLGFWKRSRSAVLPAMAPSLVTGSVTGWGGGWNALILSEYVSYGGRTYEATGIGQLLQRATVRGDTRLLVWCLVSMVGVIGLVNRFVWRRLYAVASVKFRIDG